jgi:hypothetical protein
MRKRPRTLPASWLEEWVRLEKAIKESPPTKRHQPRIQRHQSDRMRRIEQGQTPDTYKAMFRLDSYPTPIVDNDKHMIWPKDMKRPDWPTGKATDSRS